MNISENTLDDIKGGDEFTRVFTDYATSALEFARLFPKFSGPRLKEAHGSWLADLKRVQENEKHLAAGLDHFKQCGHLAFWLRRLSPVIEFTDVDLGDAELPMSAHEKAFRKLIEGYANEYLAFDFGYQICSYFETRHKEKPSPRSPDLVLSPDYYQWTCHFMKFKNVSPHAMHLIYKSLFYYSGMDPEVLSVVINDPATLAP